MPRIPKRLLALGGLVAGGAAFRRLRRANSPATPVPPVPAPASTAPTPPAAPASTSSMPTPGVMKSAPASPAPAPVVHTDDDFVAAEEAAAARRGALHRRPAPGRRPWRRGLRGGRRGRRRRVRRLELAEEQLIDNATHGGGRADPIGDAFTPEVESYERTAVDGEADEERVSELDEDDTDRR